MASKKVAAPLGGVTLPLRHPTADGAAYDAEAGRAAKAPQPMMEVDGGGVGVTAVASPSPPPAAAALVAAAVTDVPDVFRAEAAERYTLFPIRHPKIWEMYKKHEVRGACGAGHREWGKGVAVIWLSCELGRARLRLRGLVEWFGGCGGAAEGRVQLLTCCSVFAVCTGPHCPLPPHTLVLH